MVKRVFIVVLGAMLLTCFMATLALASTSEDIFNDLQDGKLDGKYTPEELEAYNNDSTYSEYPPVTNPDTTDPGDRDEFPLTGFQMLVAGVVAVGLVGGGFALRRFSRSRQS